MKTATDGDNKVLHDGDRVFTYDFDGTRVYGTLRINEDYLEVSEWYVEYDDGEDYAVLDFNFIFKT